MVTITQKELEALGSAHYTATDKSILGPYMQHWWNWALRLIPLRTHPNVVTYTGFLWLLTAVVWVFYFDFQQTYKESVSFITLGTTHAAAVQQAASTAAPWYVWIWAAIAIFMYQTFDALDGKQARRIKAGSAVGEIVDHSADAVTTIFVQYLLSSAIFRNDPMRGFILSVTVFIGFFVSHWEHYVTHVFYLGYVNAPTEGLLLTATMFVLTGTFGPSLWTDEKYYLLPQIEISAPPTVALFLPEFAHGVKVANNADIVFYTTFLLGFFTVVPAVVATSAKLIAKSVWRIVTSSPLATLSSIFRVEPSPATQRKRVRSRDALAKTAIPFFVLCLLAWEYVYRFPVLHRGNFFFVEFALGWVAALAATRVTVRRLTEAPYGFCTAIYFCTFFGLLMPLMALKAKAVFGDPAEAIASYAVLSFVPPLIPNLFLSPYVQFFTDPDYQRVVWFAINCVGAVEYVYFCWRLLVLMARHLKINLLVLTKQQLEYVDTLEAELKKEKR